MEIRGVPKPERDKAIADVAKLLQIGHLLDRKPGQLVGRPAPARRHGPRTGARSDVFLFDEPLSNLDAKLRVDMRTEIKRLHQR
jgi:multiple sugar transport system ATP-binding protein